MLARARRGQENSGREPPRICCSSLAASERDIFRAVAGTERSRQKRNEANMRRETHGLRKKRTAGETGGHNCRRNVPFYFIDEEPPLLRLPI